jgi:hypothetical protein
MKHLELSQFVHAAYSDKAADIETMKSALLYIARQSVSKLTKKERDIFAITCPNFNFGK